MMGTTIKQSLSLSVLGAVLMFGTATAQDILHGVGGAAGSDFGAVLAPAGDLDGDTVPDYLVGAPGDDAVGPGAGAARAVSGLDGSTLHEWFGAPGSSFGTALAHAGDVDQDGVADVIIGAPGLGAGEALVFSGKGGGLLRVLPGVQEDSGFGAFVGSVGDHDGDGLIDFIVGAHREDDGGLVDVGVVRLLSGADGSVLLSTAGDSAGDQWGSAGQADLPPVLAVDLGQGTIIGATQNSTFGRGYASVRDAMDFGESHHFVGELGDHAGSTVARIGDVDGDLLADYAVGTAPTIQGGEFDAASVTVYSSGTGAALFTVEGPVEASGFGSVLAGAGDVDGDGVPDLAIGEPRSDATAPDAGTVHIVSGVDGASVAIVHGAVAGGRLGAALAPATDLDLDGRHDLIVGVPGEDVAMVLSFTTWDDEDTGVAGMSGVPMVRGVGKPEAGGKTSFNLSKAALLASADLVIGHTLVLDAAAGVLVPFPDIVIEGLTTNALGQLSQDIEWSQALPPGTLIYAQYRIADGVAPVGVSRTNTVSRSVE